jgi:CRISPR-associated protein Cas1
MLPQIKERYPFIYLEYGRLEVDDSSVKWLNSDGAVVRIPCAVVNCLLLGPGTSITHEAVKVLSASNCQLCWVGEDSLLFYAAGLSPTADTQNMRHQIRLACNPVDALTVARRMFAHRFPDEDISEKSLTQLRGMEGKRVRASYSRYADRFGLSWVGRSFTPGKFELSDLTNQILTSCNAALYSIVNSALISLGYSPHVGFVHSGSPLPFTYDIADLYKDVVCIETAFSLTYELAGEYNKYRVADAFVKKIVDYEVLENIGKDIQTIFKDI